MSSEIIVGLDDSPSGHAALHGAADQAKSVERSVDGILNRWPAVGLAVVVVRASGPQIFHGHGVANIESATPVTEDTVFRIGSITKTFTAVDAIFFSILRYRYETLWAAILAHGFINTIGMSAYFIAGPFYGLW